MIIIPAIDLLDRQVVRLKQGQYNQKTVYNNDPVAQAKKFVAQGSQCLHLIDLDGARTGQMQNLDVILQIRKKAKMFLQVGGGIRTISDIADALRAGADKVAINTAAVNNPLLISQAAERFGTQCVVVAVDAKKVKSSKLQFKV